MDESTAGWTSHFGAFLHFLLVSHPDLERHYQGGC